MHCQQDCRIPTDSELHSVTEVQEMPGNRRGHWMQNAPNAERIKAKTHQKRNASRKHGN
jgi:hypothetical protein